MAAKRLAFGLGGLMLLLIAASVPLELRAHRVAGLPAAQAVLLVPFAVVGVIVAWRQPRNAIGWMLLALAIAMMLSTDVGMYSVIAFRLGHPGLPLARLAVALTQTWIALVLLLPLPIILFPDGHLPSPRWRWSFRAFLLISAVLVISTAIDDSHAFTDKVIHVDKSGELTDLGVTPDIGGTIAVALYVVIVIAWIVGKVLDYRRSSGERRQQLKWLMSGGAISLVALIANIFGGGVGFFGIVALPLAIGIGILKYRLYEIDRLVSRTISYAIVTGTLVAFFLGLVALTTDVLPFSSPVGVAASTLAAAALFNPLRRRVQRLVDRRFNRARYDAQATVDAFARRLREAVDLATVQQSLVEAVEHAVEPAHVTVWIRATA